ncbi:hypothetical protein LIR44_22830, partial [Bacteroides fragilis]
QLHRVITTGSAQRHRIFGFGAHHTLHTHGFHNRRGSRPCLSKDVSHEIRNGSYTTDYARAFSHAASLGGGVQAVV